MRTLYRLKYSINADKHWTSRMHNHTVVGLRLQCHFEVMSRTERQLNMRDEAENDRWPSAHDSSSEEHELLIPSTVSLKRLLYPNPQFPDSQHQSGKSRLSTCIPSLLMPFNGTNLLSTQILSYLSWPSPPKVVTQTEHHSHTLDAIPLTIK